MFTEILMIDLEFTSLNLTEALIWETGFVLAEFPNPRQILASNSRAVGYQPVHWCPETWDWALKLYPNSVLSKHMFARDLSTSQARELEADLLAGLHAKLSELDLSDCIVMSNHTEVDIAMLVSRWSAQGLKAPWHYRNVQDLQSVIWGLVGYQQDGFDKVGKGRAKTTHNALQDCHDQLKWLSRSLVHRGVI